MSPFPLPLILVPKRNHLQSTRAAVWCILSSLYHPKIYFGTKKTVSPELVRLEGNLETIFKSSWAAQAQNHQPLLVIQVWGKIYLLCFFTTRTYVGWACHCWWAHCSWTTSFSSLALHVVGTCWHVRKLIEKLIEKSDQNQGLDYANFTAKLNFTWCRRWQRTLGEGICFSTGRSLGRLGSCRLAEIWMIMFVRESKESIFGLSWELFMETYLHCHHQTVCRGQKKC